MVVKLVDVSVDTGTHGGPFAHWPFAVGRVEERHGLVFVHSPAPGRFRIGDYRRIPGKNRIELWDGIAVVYPEPDERSSSLMGYFYELLAHTCPEHFVPYIGPMDVPVSRTTVFAPDLLVLPSGGGRPALVVDIRRDFRPHVWRARLRGYARAGVRAHWAVDPHTLTLTVHEAKYRGLKVVWHRMDDTPPTTTPL